MRTIAFNSRTGSANCFAQHRLLIAVVALLVYGLSNINLGLAQHPDNAGMNLREQLQSLVAGNAKLDGTRIDSAKPIVNNDKESKSGNSFIFVFSFTTKSSSNSRSCAIIL